MGFDLPLVAFFFKYNVDMELTSTFKNEQLNKYHKQLIIGLNFFHERTGCVTTRLRPLMRVKHCRAG